MLFNSTTATFQTNIKVDMSVDAPSVVFVPADFWFTDGYTISVVELVGEVRKDVQHTQEMVGNDLHVQVTQSNFDGRILQINVTPQNQSDLKII